MHGGGPTETGQRADDRDATRGGASVRREWPDAALGAFFSVRTRAIGGRDGPASSDRTRSERAPDPIASRSSTRAMVGRANAACAVACATIARTSTIAHFDRTNRGRIDEVLAPLKLVGRATAPAGVVHEHCGRTRHSRPNPFLGPPSSADRRTALETVTLASAPFLGCDRRRDFLGGRMAAKSFLQPHRETGQ